MDKFFGKGQSLMEVLLAVGIGAVLVIAAVGIIAPALRISKQTNQMQAAAALGKELSDNVRAWSEGDWHNVLNLATTSVNTYFLNSGVSPFTSATGTESVLVGDVTSGLLGYWKMDEATGALVADSFGGHNGSAIGTTIVLGKFGNARSFNGTSDYVGVGSISIPTDITVSAWVYSSNFNQSGFIIGKNPVNTQWELFFESVLRWRGGDGGNYLSCSAPAPGWHFVSATQTGTNAVLYIDGSQCGSTGSAVAIANGAGAVEIGRFSSGYYFSGIIDDVRMYNRVLSATEIAALYLFNAVGSTYTRYFYVDDIQRDSNGNIVASGGSVDPSTKKVTVGYNWPRGTTTTFPFYLTRFRNNVYDQTDWSGGSGFNGPATTTNSQFSTSSGGIVFASTTGSIFLSLPAATGLLGSWATTAALPGVFRHNILVVNNGYIYSIGGADNGGATDTSTVNYALINSTGSIGAWSNTTPLPTAMNRHAAVVYNGYMYAFGGITTNTTFYAAINATGSISNWSSTTPLPSTNFDAPAVVYNSYIYTMGGENGIFSTSTVNYVLINSSTGALGNWTPTTPLPNILAYLSAVVNNGYIYTIGGGWDVTNYYAKINSGGSISNWSSTTPLPSGVGFNSAVVNNGYIYSIGGNDSSNGTSTVNFATISSTSSIGAWTMTTALPNISWYPAATANNGYIYATKGDSSQVYYAKFK